MWGGLHVHVYMCVEEGWTLVGEEEGWVSSHAWPHGDNFFNHVQKRLRIT